LFASNSETVLKERPFESRDVILAIYFEFILLLFNSLVKRKFEKTVK